MNLADEIIAFWFETLRPRDWWSAAPEVDERIRVEFADVMRTMRATPPDADALDARGHLAAVLVLDQFPRHLHRRSAEAFASDAQALAIALHAIDSGLDGALTVPQRQFLYMPLMHSEQVAMQLRSIALFTALGDRDALRSAEIHRATIDRFGRFPTRNDALARPSTAEERAFLDERAATGRGRAAPTRAAMALAEAPYPSSIPGFEGRR